MRNIATVYCMHNGIAYAAFTHIALYVYSRIYYINIYTSISFSGGDCGRLRWCQAKCHQKQKKINICLFRFLCLFDYEKHSNRWQQLSCRFTKGFRLENKCPCNICGAYKMLVWGSYRIFFIYFFWYFSLAFAYFF